MSDQLDYRIDPELVEVYIASGETKAEMVRGLLESNDIPCMFKGEAWGQIHRLTAGPMALLRIMVSAADAKRARDLIERAERGEFSVDESNEEAD